MIVKDFFEEKGVKAKPNVKGTVTMWMMGFLTVAGIVVAYWFAPALMMSLATLIIFIMMFRERNIEYEYIVANEEIEVAKIINQKRRRTAIQFDTSNIRLIAPAESIRLSNEQEKNPQMRFTDYTSLEPTSKVYGFVLDLRGINTIILLEPTDAMMEHLRKLIPNKIYED